MTGELALLTYIEEKFLKENAHLRPRDGVTARKIAEMVSKEYELVNSKFYDRKTQQEVEHSLDSLVFMISKNHNFLEVKNNKSFNRKFGNFLNDTQMSRAKDLTRKEVDNYLNKRGIVFKDEPGGGKEIRAHVIARILDAGFIVESTPDRNGIALRQLKDGYWTLKHFSVDQILDQVANGMIDQTHTTIREREIEASLREKAQKLAKHTLDERTGEFRLSTADQADIFKQLQTEHFAQRIGKTLTMPERYELESEFKNRYVYEQGLIGTPETMTLQDKRKMEHFVSSKLQELESPTIESRSTLTEYEERYRRFEQITTDY